MSIHFFPFSPKVTSIFSKSEGASPPCLLPTLIPKSVVDMIFWCQMTCPTFRLFDVRACAKWGGYMVIVVLPHMWGVRPTWTPPMQTKHLVTMARTWWVFDIFARLSMRLVAHGKTFERQRAFLNCSNSLRDIRVRKCWRNEMESLDQNPRFGRKWNGKWIWNEVPDPDLDWNEMKSAPEMKWCARSGLKCNEIPKSGACTCNLHSNRAVTRRVAGTSQRLSMRSIAHHMLSKRQRAYGDSPNTLRVIRRRKSALATLGIFQVPYLGEYLVKVNSLLHVIWDVFDAELEYGTDQSPTHQYHVDKRQKWPIFCIFCLFRARTRLFLVQWSRFFDESERLYITNNWSHWPFHMSIRLWGRVCIVVHLHVFFEFFAILLVPSIEFECFEV